MQQQQYPPLTPHQQEREARRRESLGLARANLSTLPSRRPSSSDMDALNNSNRTNNPNSNTSAAVFFSPTSVAKAPTYRSQEMVERRRRMQDITPANDMILAEQYNRFGSSLRPDSAIPNGRTTTPVSGNKNNNSAMSTPRSGGGGNSSMTVTMKQGSFSAKNGAGSPPVMKAVHNSNWNRSLNPTTTTADSSGGGVSALTRVPATTARIAKASKDTLLQLERNFNDLVAKRQHCDKSENSCLKEYSVLSHAIDEAEAAISQLQLSYEEHELLVGGFRSLPETVMQSPGRNHENAQENSKNMADPHRDAFKMKNVRRRGGGGGDRGHYGHHAPDSTTFVGLNDTNKSLRHGETLLEGVRILKGKIDGARQLLEDTAVASQKTQHMSQLIDTAMNVDLICMGRKADEGHIAVNAAPAFPHMTLDDFDKVIQRSAALTTYCTRVAEDLRKVVVNALAGHSEASKALVAAMRLGLKCAHTKREEALRQADYLHAGKRKCIKDLDEVLQEEADLEEQIARLARIHAIRSTAASAAVFGGNGSASIDSDPVMYTLNIQMGELQVRLNNEVLRKKEMLGNEVRGYEEAIDGALQVVELNTADEGTIQRVEEATARWM